MFLGKNYILANELIEKMGINIANISKLKKIYEESDDFYTIKSLGNCSFINQYSHKLPRYIKKGIKNFELTDFSDKLPCIWTRNELELTEKKLFDCGIVIDKVKLFGKQFYVFDNEFIEKTRGKILYVLSESELPQCLEVIDGYIRVSNNKYLCWYSYE